MRAYPSRQPLRNNDPRPPLPRLAWTLEQRKARFGADEEAARPGRGTARRHRREHTTDKYLAWLERTRAGTITFPGANGLRYTLADLVWAAAGERSPGVLDLRERARALDAEAEDCGPASGWALPQPPPLTPGNGSWTRYVVPKSAEKCWRYFRRVARDLKRTLELLAYWWGAHGPSTSQSNNATTREGQEKDQDLRQPAKPYEVQGPVCDPRGPAGARLDLRFGM